MTRAGPGSRGRLLVALAAVAAGTAAFILYLAVFGIDGEQRPLGLLDWVVCGVLVGPGFGLLIRWRRARQGAG